MEELIHEVQYKTDTFSSPGFALGVGMALTPIVLIALLAIAIAFVIDAFIVNPLEVGSKRFFLRNLNQPAEIKEVAYAFDNNYKEIVKAILLRDVFVALWPLLLIIPVIIKSYEYRMIPYLMADDPTLTRTQAFQMSKSMMQGNKWKAFVLDLSFIGWEILSVFTLGILSLFYVSPYMQLTNAALYERLRYEVAEAGDGAEALDAIDSQPIDLCLLDIMIPRLDGYAVLKHVRTKSDVPIIVISAKDQDPEKILGLNLGADDYMVKPFNPLEGVAWVNTNIRRAKGTLMRNEAAL